MQTQKSPHNTAVFEQNESEKKIVIIKNPYKRLNSITSRSTDDQKGLKDSNKRSTEKFMPLFFLFW